MIRTIYHGLKKYFRPLIAIALLFLITQIGLIDLSKIKDNLYDIELMSVGFILLILSNLAITLRWHYLVNFETLYKLKEAIRDFLIGHFFNFFIPSGVGGDIVKALSLAEKNNLPRKTTFSLATSDRIIGLYSIIIFSFVFLLAYSLESHNYIYTKFILISFVLLLISTFGLAIVIYSQWLEKLNTFLDHKLKLKILIKVIHFLLQIKSLLKKIFQLQNFLKIFSINLMAQMLSIGFLYFAAQKIYSHSVSFLIFFPLCCFAFMASAVPLTPAGIGVGQAAFYFIFSTIDKDLALAVSTAISLMQVINLIISLPGGLLFTLKNKKKV